MKLKISFVCVIALFALNNSSAAKEVFQLEEATIDSVHQSIQNNQMTCEALITSYIDRIKQYNFNTNGQPPINALSEINPSVLDNARLLDMHYAKTKQLVGPLHCIPIVVKENVDTFDTTTTVGSFALLGNQPVKDAFLISELRRAGALILAKGSMDEFAWGMLGINSHSGRIGNAFDPTKNPGGSSGGSAAAVSANFALLGIGTDNSGSVRIPAAFNGVIGLRPTPGLISQSGIFPLGNLDGYAGPLARTVTDLAHLLDVIASKDLKDPKTSLQKRPKSYADSLNKLGLQGKRIAVINHIGDIDCYQDMPSAVKTELQKTFLKMQQLGATLITNVDLSKFDNDRTFNQAGEVEDVNEYFKGFPGTRRNFSDICTSKRTALFGTQDNCLNFVKKVPGRSSVEYAQVLDIFRKNKMLVENFMDQNHLDAILVPICTLGSATYDEKAVNTWRAPLSSNAELPAITFIAGYNSADNNMPIGIELVGKAYTEAQLIEMAYAFEQNTDPRHVPVFPKPNPLLMAHSIAELNSLISQLGQNAYEQVLKKGEVKALTPEIFRALMDDTLKKYFEEIQTNPLPAVDKP